MNIRIITASAGSGKTYRLTEVLDAAIAAGRARPDSIVATTFTNQAAAELVERARGRLLQNGRTREAHQLLAARIGTVNAVCGSLVGDFAFELGMSPAVRVLDDVAAELEFRRALARVVSPEQSDALDQFKMRFERDLVWPTEVRRIVEAARANALGPEHLAACAQRSIADLDACLGPCATLDLDAALAAAIETAVGAIDTAYDETAGTADYVELLHTTARDLARGRLGWGAWATLASKGPRKKSEAHAAPVQAIAARHLEHPRLRREMGDLIRGLFDVAARGLAAYATYKRERGLIDFIDQEAHALALLKRPDVRAALAGQIDLFLVDEFQDTSPLQLALFLELASLAREAIWVGDPKQAIYGFRGTDPALMDAAVESLTSLKTDAELVAAATRAVSHGHVETLDTSYRSRPQLVRLTSEIFARAFASQGMPEERTRLTPHLVTEPPGLGDVVEYWPFDDCKNAGDRASAVAAGVRELLARGAAVRDGDGVRPARRRDVAVLCRTNVQCQAVADALAGLGVPAVVPRMALLDTLEIMVALAGLALWIDPDDAVAAADLARLVTYPADLDGLVAQALATPGSAAFRDDPTVARLLAARAAGRDLGPVAAVDAVLDASALRELCAGWGDAAQRVANLDALRAHATVYAERAAAAGDAATVVGLVRYLEDLAAAGGWRDVRTDRQAVLAGEDAVTISTWHRAKGLELPITILFGLESVREPRSHGVHVLTDRAVFEVDDPLGGRWIRYWPNPYTNSNQKGAVREAFEASSAHAHLVDRAAREALRVLYVGWTRARDRLVLAAQRGKLLAGIVGTLAEIDPTLVVEPRATISIAEVVTWAGVDVEVYVCPERPVEPSVTPPIPGTIAQGRAPAPRIPARRSPSTASPVPCTLGRVVELGPRLAVTGTPDMALLGDAVHGFLAADRPGLDDRARLALAAELLAGFDVASHLVAADVVAAGTRLWAWIDAHHAGARLHREWPVAHRTAAGTIVGGTADLVLVDARGFTLIDHKTFPGGMDVATQRARAYSGQLAAYRDAIRAAIDVHASTTWIHFPVLGTLVEVCLDESCPT